MLQQLGHSVLSCPFSRHVTQAVPGESRRSRAGGEASLVKSRLRLAPAQVPAPICSRTSSGETPSLNVGECQRTPTGKESVKETFVTVVILSCCLVNGVSEHHYNDKKNLDA